ncbi:MAG: putative selenate reductase subunit YgfK [Candidatus Marinimicrobia bacterium]|nr:putative selenate reductase subunit YgfK [Candidatus Neomarinimicrobiota bacterium]
MSDRLLPLSTEALVHWVFTELEDRQSIFGIPRAAFFDPAAARPLVGRLFGQPLDTPLGVAAGPHTQMAQNLVAAWLCGARFFELKTVQTLDALHVTKPCMDMQDEGYNVEWSQELRLTESLAEYARAWALIHGLHRVLGFPGERPGIIFNLSVGYDLAGLKQPNMQAFLRGARAAGTHLAPLRACLAARDPALRDLAVPDCLSNNVTVSTMHGCPPEEIGAICAYLMEEWGLHTYVKLNPTLLGPATVRSLLGAQLGFREIEVPDEAFAHDLRWDDALELIRGLEPIARRAGVQFGVKLCNTLEVVNHRAVFPPREERMYLSGRPHHVLAVTLAHRLQEAFDGRLHCSFAGGADAFNVPALLAAGMETVTVCSDLLRTGGYLRLGQYATEILDALAAGGAATVAEWPTVQSGLTDRRAAARANLAALATQAPDNPVYHRDRFERARTKTSRLLRHFDCIAAPCTDECPIDQQAPRYLRAVARGDDAEALAIVRADNPMPAVLGRACNHLCEAVCTRTQLDEPLAIRELKRYILDRAAAPPEALPAPPADAPRVAVIGAGPCGLATAYELVRAGLAVTVYEARAYAGGMVAGSIPGYRACQAALEQDLRVLLGSGFDLRLGQQAGRDFALAGLRAAGFQYLVVAVGAQRGLPLGLPGEQEIQGVFDGLDFLRRVREGHPPLLGARVAVIGGGDVAMDCARTARRLTAGTVAVLYRRTRAEMPAQREEREGLLLEGIELVERVAPKGFLTAAGCLTGITCARMRLDAPDASGRRRPVEIPRAEVSLPVDQVIVAIGQQPDFDFLATEPLTRNQRGYLEADPATGLTSVPDIYAGGDAVGRGPATIVEALGAARRMAAGLARRAGRTPGRSPPLPGLEVVDVADAMQRRAWRLPRVAIPQLDPEHRNHFQEVVKSLEPSAARREARRCLDCDQFCGLCVGVCPNRAFFTYEIEPRPCPWPADLGRAGEGSGGYSAASQRYQVAVFTPFCNECGNCQTFCPTAGAPYRDKPRLYLDRAEFEAEADNAFLLWQEADESGIWMRWSGRTHQLTFNGAGCRYAAPGLLLELDPASGRRLRREISGPGPFDAAPLRAGWTLWHGLQPQAHLPRARRP